MLAGMKVNATDDKQKNRSELPMKWAGNPYITVAAKLFGLNVNFQVKF